MRARTSIPLLLLLAAAPVIPPPDAASQPAARAIGEIPCPAGFTRSILPETDFGTYLRALPLRTGDRTVYLFDGRRKSNQSAQHAVVDLDVGTSDLQQCADAIMRLRAEYLYARAEYSKIHFSLLGIRKPCRFLDHCRGRTRIQGASAAT